MTHLTLHPSDRGTRRYLLTLALAVLASGCDSVTPSEPFLEDTPAHFALVDMDPESALLVSGDGRFANLVMAESVYEQFRTGTWNAPLPQKISRRVFNGRFSDDFDFLIVTFDPDRPRAPLPVGVFNRVRNDVVGINYLRFHDEYGLWWEDSLRSAQMVPSADDLRPGATLHEIAHTWGATLTPTRELAKYWGLSGVGGQLGGWVTGTLETPEPGVYRGHNPAGAPFSPQRNGGGEIPYAPLELYMMGFLSPDSVPPIEVAFGGQMLDADEGTFRADSIVIMTMDDLDLFPRDPSWLEAPRDFRVLLVVLSAAPLGADVAAAISHDVGEFGRAGPDDDDGLFNFWEATGGRATLRFDGLVEAVVRGFDG